MAHPLPIKEKGYTSNKKCFWDLLQLRCGWQLQKLPTTCECGARFTMDHALSRKKGGFINLGDNQTWDLTGNLLKIYHDVLIELTLQQLTSESLDERTANITDKACVDILARFSISGQQPFFWYKSIQPNGLANPRTH